MNVYILRVLIDLTAQLHNRFPVVFSTDVRNSRGILHNQIQVVVQIRTDEIPTVRSQFSMNLYEKKKKQNDAYR